MEIGELLVIALFILALVILSPVIAILGAYTYVSDKIENRRFRSYLKRNEGLRFFCYTSRKTDGEAPFLGLLV